MNQKTKLAKLLDSALLLIGMFLLLFSILSKITKTPTVALVFSIFFSLVIFLFILKQIKRKESIKTLNHQEKQKQEKSLTALKFGDPIKIKQFWINALKRKYEIKSTNKQFIEIKNQSTNALIYYNFESLVIEHSTILDLICKNKNNLPIFILGNAFSDDAKTFALSHNNIHILDQNASYEVLKKLNSFPTLPSTETKKISRIKKLQNAIKKENSTKFFRYGSLLLILSFFIPYSAFYKIAGSLFLIFGVMSLLKKQKLTPAPEYLP